MKHAHIKVTGHVQGVFFRATTKDIADQLNLLGYAKNLEDGSLEIMVIGNEESIDQLIRWCWQGPPAARVENVHVALSENLPEFLSFEIL